MKEYEGASRLFSLQNGQRCLDLIILVVLVLDIVVDAGNFLCANSVFVAIPFAHDSISRYLLKRDNDLAQRFVGSVFDFVPME